MIGLAAIGSRTDRWDRVDRCAHLDSISQRSLHVRSESAPQIPYENQSRRQEKQASDEVTRLHDHLTRTLSGRGERMRASGPLHVRSDVTDASIRTLQRRAKRSRYQGGQAVERARCQAHPTQLECSESRSRGSPPQAVTRNCDTAPRHEEAGCGSAGGDLPQKPAP